MSRDPRKKRPIRGGGEARKTKADLGEDGNLLNQGNPHPDLGKERVPGAAKRKKACIVLSMETNDSLTGGGKGCG